MWEFVDWGVTGFLFVVLLLLTCSVYVVYSGLLTEIHISTGSSPVKSMTVAYKYKQGPYKDSSLLFAESCRVAPELPTVGVFYDDPKKGGESSAQQMLDCTSLCGFQVPGPECRCAVGSILSEGDQRPNAELQELYEKFGFRIFTFPEVTHVVSSRFPYRTRLSVLLGVYRVYPQLDRYIKSLASLSPFLFLSLYPSLSPSSSCPPASA
ncbi:testis-expressed protein 264-like isoform X1 [Tachysurus fulvidraco]|uniref:testis-expressed protein 264-like isoform X1 n=1 Tax=Tachysurus fulvidraco TaxID=1234273 RepID=UPI001FEDB758|nr:testis-expressed protein 264-like isoform X1 [Tachysurus fulvidraco]